MIFIHIGAGAGDKDPNLISEMDLQNMLKNIQSQKKREKYI